MRHRLTATLLLLAGLAAPAVPQVRLLETGLICPGETPASGFSTTAVHVSSPPLSLPLR